MGLFPCSLASSIAKPRASPVNLAEISDDDEHEGPGHSDGVHLPLSMVISASLVEDFEEELCLFV